MNINVRNTSEGVFINNKHVANGLYHLDGHLYTVSESGVHVSKLSETVPSEDHINHRIWMSVILYIFLAVISIAICLLIGALVYVLVNLLLAEMTPV